MIAEKPIWIKHEGMQIFSIDVQPGGLRFATGGGDHKVRIWSTRYIGKDDLEIQDSASQLLATLRDHFGSVNCVRWAKHGRLIASGSDDQVIQIHERKPGSGTAEFGSGEAPDVENWKVAMTLRGHTADVVDLNWSPDDLILASGSLDNTVHIWNMSTGLCTAVLRGHSSLVKGVTWDPIGSFIASQSDDKTVIIWRTSDWSLAHRTDGHWAKSLGSTFFRRLGWSPCGHFITTTHGFQKPRHSAPVLERGEWSATFDFLGHNAPIIVVKFNNSMFRRTPSDNNNSNNNGTSKKESQPYNVIAIGSQDRTITLWTTASARPLFVAKHFFTQSVVDLSWSPDGYSLYACSLDGTIAAFHFKVTELGQRLTEAELDDLKKSRYGDTRGRLSNLAESPAQLLLEAAATKQTIAKKPTIIDVLQNPTSFKTTTKPPLPPQNVQDGKKVSAGPISENLNKLPPTASQKTPVRQREIRAPDGRRRITPETIGVVGNQLENITDLVQNQNFLMNPLDKNCDVEVSVKKTIGVTARASVCESLVIEKIPESSRRDGGLIVEQIGRTGSIVANVILIRVFDKYDDEIPICLEARPREEAVTDNLGGGILKDETEISCIRGNQTIWSDRIAGKVTVLAGNANIWAAGCEDGCLQIYTKCGRRAMPTMMMGSSAIFIDCDELWKLLVVTKKGLLYVWDLFSRKCLLRDSLSSLITPDPKSNGGKIKVISAKLSKSGSPLIVLATRHAFIYDISLKCWLRVVDDAYSCSIFASSLTLGPAHCGELAGLQVDANKFLSRKPSLTRASDDGVETRAHLEAQLASSLALGSANEYRNSLVSYVRCLTREADESRLREVCESFIGPPTGMGETNHPSWDSSVLGMKKHKLLKDDILPAMASNRKVQRLLNEFLDIFSENQTSNELTKSTNFADQLKNTTKLIEADQENPNPQEKHQMNSNPKPADNLQPE